MRAIVAHAATGGAPGTKYRVANWAAYNQALVRRGDVTVWLSSEAIAAWTPRRSGRRGGQRRYSDLAIETALTLRLIYHLPLRQAEGFLHALFGMMRLDLSAPDYTTLSRRSQHLRRRLRPVPPGAGLHLVLGRTSLSLVGAGAWAAAIPGGRGQRGWRTRHRGGDRSGVILVHPLPVRCPPCGRRRAPRSPTSGPITDERDQVRPLAPPVAVWAAFWGRYADVAAAAGSRAVGRRWAWRCAGLVRR